MEEEIKNNLKRKTNFIGVDIDDNSVYNLLLTYLLIKRRYPEEEIITEVSPSGKGFHITIKLKEPITILENFFERSVLQDDPYRLSLNLKKFLISDGKDTNTDLLFTEKSGKKVKVVYIESILRKYRGTLREIQKKWGSNEALELIKNISELIKEKIPTKKGWVTSIGIKGEVLKEKTKKIAMDISLKDETFKWKIFKSYFPQYDFSICIFSKSKDKGMQRGAWMKRVLKKEYNEDILYYVKEI